VSDQLLRIGQVAGEAGVTTRTVDYYTSLGLLTPGRPYRRELPALSRSAVGLIAAVRGLEAHGISLDAIAAALRDPPADLGATLDQLDRDLRALHAAVAAAPHPHGLLAAITARAQGLISTALDLAGILPPPPA
jgi:DNA-binding transcriptional MerR regulator